MNKISKSLFKSMVKDEIIILTTPLLLSIFVYLEFKHEKKTNIIEIIFY